MNENSDNGMKLDITISNDTNKVDPLEPMSDASWWTRLGKEHWLLGTIISFLIALSAPTYAYINGHYELQIKERESIHKIRMQYINSVIDPQKPISYKLSVLEFLQGGFEKDDGIRIWAERKIKQIEEIIGVEKSITKLKNDIRIERKVEFPSRKKINNINLQANIEVEKLKKLARLSLIDPCQIDHITPINCNQILKGNKK